MRLDNLRTESTDRRRRLTARVSWEAADRPDFEFYYEVPEEYGPDLRCRAEPLVAAALPAASWYGEERLVVEGEVCPRLKGGLDAVIRKYCIWYDRCHPVEIEATQGLGPPPGRDRRRTGLLLSGGIDSLALLREHRSRFPAEHPERVRDCLLVFGLNSYDLRGGVPVAERVAAFEKLRDRMEGLTAPERETLIPVYTNVRNLYSDFDTWVRVGTGGGIVSNGLALGRRLTDLWVGGDGFGWDDSPPRGLHRSLTHLFSTSGVRAHYGQPGLRRLDKTRLVAAWEEGLAHLRSCYCLEVQPPPDLNCGRCEKCVRTMLALVAVGALDRAVTYPRDDLDPETIRDTEVAEDHLPYYAECIGPLEERGRGDLAAAVRRKMEATDRAGSPPLEGALRRLVSWVRDRRWSSTPSVS